MVEDAAGLDYIKDKVAKRTEEIIFHAECEKSVQIAWTLGTEGIESRWTLTCTGSKAFCLQLNKFTCSTWIDLYHCE